MKVINGEAHKRIIEILHSSYGEEADAIYGLEGNRSQFVPNGSLISTNRIGDVMSRDKKVIADGWLVIDSICEIVMNIEGISEEVFAKHVINCDYIKEITYEYDYRTGSIEYAVPLENLVDFMLRCDRELNILREIIPFELYNNIDDLKQIIEECEDID